MAILTTDDFKTLSEVQITLLNPDGSGDIDDAKVQIYWDLLAKHVKVSIDDLPAVPSAIVKEYLIYYVAYVVAGNSVGNDLQQITENISVDQWEIKRKSYKNRFIELKSDIQTSDVIDPTKLEDTTITNNTMMTTWQKG